ncbi:unnamed protein product [Mycena citricolor]|uniref:Uncharacterized protein n=1 Tax=Mycena citricolor TaxID=2018698 RepID=A0AAD2JVX9_9AGAR|nr:unnamed protein product [Mycena citricolor]CAK5265038.1 unnamed protein product [Mycena citricolor]
MDSKALRAVVARQLNRAPTDNCGWAANSDSNEPCAVKFCGLDHSYACSNLVFFLRDACDYCMNPESPPLTWQEYALEYHCDPSTPSPIRTDLPSASQSNVVPSWALAMAAATPFPTTFNIQAAQNLASFCIPTSGTLPSAPGMSSTSSLASSASSTFSAMSSTEASSSPTNLTPHKGASVPSGINAGAIAGGVIGAMLFVLVTGVVFWVVYRRRKRSRMAPSAVYKAALRAGTPNYHHVMTSADPFEDSPRNSTDA